MMQDSQSLNLCTHVRVAVLNNAMVLHAARERERERERARCSFQSLGPQRGQPPALKDLAGWVSQQVLLDRGHVERAIQLLQEGVAQHCMGVSQK